MAARRWVLLGAVALSAVGLAACSSSTTATTTTTSTPASTTSSTGSSSSSTGASSTTYTTTPGGPTQCPTPKLAASIYGSSGAAGTIQETVALTSSAAAPCTLGGYPGLQMLSAAGAKLPTTVVRKGNYPFTAMAPTTVTLAPGAAAYFNLGYSDVPSGTEVSCPASASLAVTPPNSYTSTSVAAQLDPCDNGTITVSPVFSGTGAAAQTRASPQ